MKFYVHSGSEEPLGTGGRYIWEDLKTRGGAIRRARRIFKGKPFTLYTFTNFYNKSTFRCILKGAAFGGDAPNALEQYHNTPTVPGGSHGEVYDTRVYNHTTGKWE